MPSGDDATRIANALLNQRLAASVNILPAIHSLYTWQGKRCNVGEVLLLAKTKAGLFARLVAAVQGLHPYLVPGIIALPILMGHEGYLDWIDQAVDPESEPWPNQ